MKRMLSTFLKIYLVTVAGAVSNFFGRTARTTTQMFKSITRYSTCLLLMVLLLLSGCSTDNKTKPLVVENQPSKESTDINTGDEPAVTAPTSTAATPSAQEVTGDEVFSFIDKSGTSLATRVNPPSGYTRMEAEPNGLTEFLRNLPLKEDQSEVLLYDGLPKANQSTHVVVFQLDPGNKDLQQCADSVMRIYAEYYWSIKQYDKIAFHLTNGFLMEYTKWRDGNRLVVDKNDVRWSKTEAYDASYECFRRYLTTVFIYAGTLSLSEECTPISLADIKPGDMFLEGGSPGHCVLVVDMALDKDNNRCFLLAQGYMPAQDFHIIKNPLHPEDPWYYTTDLTYPLSTPLWSFEEGSLVRWSDFDESASIPAMAGQQSSNESSPDTSSLTSQDTSPDTSTVTSPDASQVTLLAVGDNLIHIQVVESGLQTDGSYNYDHLYSNMKDVISAADIAIVNQETILGGEEFAYSGYPDFNSPTQIGDALVHAGFDVVTQATNHTLDMGSKGVENTLSFWKQYPKITLLGINESEKASENIAILEKNGIKIAFLNYTYGLNGRTVPKEKSYLVNMLDKKEMAKDIAKAEELADFTIVLPHWGTEYQYEENSDQEYYTSFFYEAGVDLVIGTHPHVLEPVEWIGKEGARRMLVYYSLGNFISYQKEAPRMLGGIASVTITKDSTGTFISSAGITPIITHFENGPADYNYAIYPLKEYNESFASLHGVSELAKNGPLTYKGTYDLATQVLGGWFK